MKSKRIVASVLAIMVAFTIVLIPESAMAATKSGNIYELYKYNEAVYCIGYTSVFRYDIDTEELDVFYDGYYHWPSTFAVKGDYMYLLASMNASAGPLYKINLNSGSKKKLESGVGRFVVSGSKIYYNKEYCKNNWTRYKKMKMSLNGKSKTSTKYKSKPKAIHSNTDDYWIDWDDNGDVYLETPDDEIFLESFPY